MHHIVQIVRLLERVGNHLTMYRYVKDARAGWNGIIRSKRYHEPWCGGTTIGRSNVFAEGGCRDMMLLGKRLDLPRFRGRSLLSWRSLLLRRRDVSGCR